MGELDVGVGERVTIGQLESMNENKSLRGLGKLLETDDGGIDRSRRPLVMRYKRAPNTTISFFFIISVTCKLTPQIRHHQRSSEDLVRP